MLSFQFVLSVNGSSSIPVAIARSFEAELAALQAVCSARSSAFDLAESKAIH